MNQTNLIGFYGLDNRKSKFESNKNKQDGLDYEVYYDLRYNILIKLKKFQKNNQLLDTILINIKYQVFLDMFLNLEIIIIY